MKRAWLVALAAISGACEPSPTEGTGGVDLVEQTGPSGQSCGRGFAVVMSDYVSTSVGVVDLSGETVSGTFISSSSASTKLNAALGGDVVLPSVMGDDELVLLDRYPTAVLTFVDWKTARVRGQLDVGQDFASNPQDYLRLDDHHAWVTRANTNPNPDAPALARGDDILVVDPLALTIESSIDLSGVASDGYQAQPGRMLRLGEGVVVTLSLEDAAHQSAEDGRLAIVDARTQELAGTVEVKGFSNCVTVAATPSGKELTVACSGLLADADSPRPSDSGLVRFSVVYENGLPKLSELERVAASDLGHGPLGFSAAYLSEYVLLVGTFGALEGKDAGRADAVWWWDTRSGDFRQLVASSPRPFTLGGIQCSPGCGVCLIADAGRGVLQRLESTDDGFVQPTAIPVHEQVGLPPREVGLF